MTFSIKVGGGGGFMLPSPPVPTPLLLDKSIHCCVVVKDNMMKVK